MDGFVAVSSLFDGLSVLDGLSLASSKYWLEKGGYGVVEEKPPCAVLAVALGSVDARGSPVRVEN